MFFGQPKRSITSSALGSAASLLAVVNAIRNGSRTALRNVRNGTRMISDTPPRTTRAKTIRPPYISSTSLPSVRRIPRPILPTVAAIAAITPNGANSIT